VLQAVALVARAQLAKVDETQVPPTKTKYPLAQVVQVEVVLQLEQLVAVQLLDAVVVQEYVVVGDPVEAVIENPVLQALQT
jgi:hypothetical protein